MAGVKHVWPFLMLHNSCFATYSLTAITRCSSPSSRESNPFIFFHTMHSWIVHLLSIVSGVEQHHPGNVMDSSAQSQQQFLPGSSKPMQCDAFVPFVQLVALSQSRTPVSLESSLHPCTMSITVVSLLVLFNHKIVCTGPCLKYQVHMQYVCPDLSSKLQTIPVQISPKLFSGGRMYIQTEAHKVWHAKQSFSRSGSGKIFTTISLSMKCYDEFAWGSVQNYYSHFDIKF